MKYQSGVLTRINSTYTSDRSPVVQLFSEEYIISLQNDSFMLRLIA